MTAQEMHYEWRLRYNEVETQERKDYNVAEIDAFLTDAAQQKVKLNYLVAEQDQRNMDDLSTLVINSPNSSQSVVTPFQVVDGIYEFRVADFAFPYMHLYRANIAVSECSDFIKLKLIQHDDLAFTLTNFHQNPSLKWRRGIGVIGRSSDGTGQSIFVHSNGAYTVTGLYPTYLKLPNPITIGGYIGLDGVVRVATDCDLPTHVHSSIVDLAVQNALGSVALPQEYQVAQIKTQSNI